MLHKTLCYALFSAAICMFMPLFAQTTSDKQEIVFGQTGAFTGHFKMYARAIVRGIEACFRHTNDTGGIEGKTLRLVSLDDGGDYEKFKNNIQTLQTQFNTSMFIGLMDTSNIRSLLPRVKQGKLTVLFPWAEHKDFQNPALTHMINGPGLLSPQLKALAQLDKVLSKKFAIFHGDDNFSTRAAQTLLEHLKANDQTPVAVESFNLFTMDIETPAAALMKKYPKVVLCICTSAPAVALIKYFFTHGAFGTQFVGIDSTFPVKDILKYTGVTFSYSSAVPDPETAEIALAQEYRESMKKYFPSEPLSTLSFMYYLSASIVVEAIKQCAQDITPQAIVEKISAMKKTELGGYPLDFDPSTRYVFGKKTWII